MTTYGTPPAMLGRLLILNWRIRLQPKRFPIVIDINGNARAWFHLCGRYQGGQRLRDLTKDCPLQFTSAVLGTGSRREQERAGGLGHGQAECVTPRRRMMCCCRSFN